jgi:hypothetical protein
MPQHERAGDRKPEPDACRLIDVARIVTPHERLENYSSREPDPLTAVSKLSEASALLILQGLLTELASFSGEMAMLRSLAAGAPASCLT